MDTLLENPDEYAVLGFRGEEGIKDGGMLWAVGITSAKGGTALLSKPVLDMYRLSSCEVDDVALILMYGDCKFDAFWSAN